MRPVRMTGLTNRGLHGMPNFNNFEMLVIPPTCGGRLHVNWGHMS